MRSANSIARRLLVTAFMWSSGVMVAALLIISLVYRQQSYGILEEDLSDTLISLTRSITFLPDSRITDREETLLPEVQEFQVPLSGRYWAVISVDEGGVIVSAIRSKSLWDGELPVSNQILSKAIDDPGSDVFGDEIGPNDEQVRVAARAIVLPNRSTPLVLLAARDVQQTSTAVGNLFYMLLGALFVLLLLIMAAMSFGVRYALRPLATVQADLEDIREGRATALPDEYPIEIQPLSGEVNKLLEHNRGVVQRARTHVGNLAHALKTPLAVLRNEATGEGGLDVVVRRQTEAMRENVDHYLRRAQAAARAEALGSRADIRQSVESLARMLGKLFASKGVDVEVIDVADVSFRGEKQDLEEMLGNLMDNACKWARTLVEVSVERDGPDEVLIHIDDDGPGLSKEERSAALKRGVRLDETAPGTGLGLSIVTEIAEMHKGSFTLSHAPIGGLRATLRLPAA